MIWHFGIHYAVYTASVVFSPQPSPPAPVPVVQVVKAPTPEAVPTVVTVAPTTTTTAVKAPVLAAPPAPTTTTTTVPPPTTTTTQPKNWVVVKDFTTSGPSKTSASFWLVGGDQRVTWNCDGSCSAGLYKGTYGGATPTQVWGTSPVGPGSGTKTLALDAGEYAFSCTTSLPAKCSLKLEELR